MNIDDPWPDLDQAELRVLAMQRKLHHLTGLVESPVLRNGHAGFGGRPGETGWSKDQYRVPGRPYVVMVGSRHEHANRLATPAAPQLDVEPDRCR